MSARLLILGKRAGILRWYEHLLDAAPLEGLEIRGFAINHHSWPERLQKRALLKLRGWDAWHAHTAHKLARVTEAFRPGMILIVDLFYLSGHMIRVLEALKGNTRIAQWIGDNFEPRLLHNAQVVDRFYFTNAALTAAALDLGLGASSTLPLAYNPAIYANHGTPLASRSNRPLFIGAYSRNRAQFFEAIRVPMDIYGKGWKPHALPRHHCHDGNIGMRKVASLYNRHACVVNATNLDHIASGLNMRCFEAPACGCLLVTENVADLWSSYDQGEVAAYRSAEECEAALEMLEGEKERAASIASAGESRATRHHRYRDRLRQIADELRGE